MLMCFKIDVYSKYKSDWMIAINVFNVTLRKDFYAVICVAYELT